MNETGTDNPHDSVRVTIASTEYTIVAGTSMDIVILLANPGTSGDFFEVNLLGIPLSWITNTGSPAVWVSAGGQEKVTLTLCPPEGEGSIGSYPLRLRVTSQGAPDKSQELAVFLKVVTEGSAKRIILSVESNDFPASPGTKIKIPLIIRSLLPEAGFLELSVQGVPTSWVTLPAPVLRLSGGEEKTVDVFLQIPATPEVQAGDYPIKIVAAYQNEPDIKNEVEVKLRIAAFESQGRVGVRLISVQYAAAPGSRLEIPLTVLNRGLEADVFRVGIEEMPLSWVSTATPSVSLQPGESKEITLVITPPLSPQTQAGRYKFQITLTSLGYPDQIVRVECVLTVATFTQFKAVMEPLEAKAGQPVRVTVQNEGNITQAFHISCDSQNDQLMFEFMPPEQPKIPEKPAQSRSTTDGNGKPAAVRQVTSRNPQAQAPAPASREPAGDPTLLSIPPGEAAAFRFTAQPRQRSFFGGPVSIPYRATVRSNEKDAQTLVGRVVGGSAVPIWVLPIALVLCLCLVFSFSAFLVRGGLLLASSDTQTPTIAVALATGVTQIPTTGTAAAAGATQISATGTAAAAAATQTIMANQTAAAIAASQTLSAQQTAGGAAQTAAAGTAAAIGATQTAAAGMAAAIGATQTIIAYQTSAAAISQQQTATAAALIPTATSMPPTATNMPPTATPTQQPTPTIAPTQPPTQASLPRFKGVILFESNRDGNPEIYTTDDAGHIKRMTDSPATDSQAAWAPNIQQVAFTSNRDGQNDIYLMNADGTNVINLTNNPADDQQPAWSVDGKWIAFTSNRSGNYEIYILQLSNLEVRNLTNSPGNDFQPNWVRSPTMDPSGEFILFTSDRDGNQEIYRMNTDGTGVMNLSNNPASDQMAKGSTDGTLVVFTTNRDGNQEIYSMKSDGSGQTNLTNNPANDFGPSWSPDQAWVDFSTNRNGNYEVFLQKLGVPELYNLTNNPSQDLADDWR